MGKNIQPLPLEDHQDGVTQFDADYVLPEFTSSHLLVEKGCAAFIDNRNHTFCSIIAESS